MFDNLLGGLGMVVSHSGWKWDDLVYDLGPEGGSKGGEIVAMGRPDEIAMRPGRSATAKLLRDVLRRSEKPARGRSKRAMARDV